jgi:adenosylcobinamide kinase/adenosylcobinamide-phosphate guanylyltransferase
VPVTLITGPTRSGKSLWAEKLALRSHQSVIYIATAISSDQDPEWQDRLALHRSRRPLSWQTWEIPTQLVEALAECPAESCCLVDSLGTWTANWLEASPEIWQRQVEDLLYHLQRSEQTVILVGEEVGWGVVPAFPTGRQFRDRLGSLTQAIASFADQVYLVVAGYGIDLRKYGFLIDSPQGKNSEIADSSLQ